MPADDRGAGMAKVEAAQRRWRLVKAPHLVALVRAVAASVNGKLVERPGEPSLPGSASSSGLADCGAPGSRIMILIHRS